MKTLEINWKLNSYCEYGCEYCHGKWSKGNLDKTLDQYLDVIEKLQETRYPHGDKIKWILGGGEPLNFPNLNQLLQYCGGFQENAFNSLIQVERYSVKEKLA